MAWYCSGSNNNALIVNLQNQGIVHTNSVIEGMKLVDRGNYATNSEMNPYSDTPHYIGHGQTISAPHMHGYALECLEPGIMKKDAHILDVGVGSGYLSAVMARMNPSATVYGIDVIEPLVFQATNNFLKKDADLLTSKRVILDTANGWLGYPVGAPYDVIHVGAGATALPQDLLKQLKVGGRMVVPVGESSWMQEFLKIERIKGKPDWSTPATDTAHMTTVDISDFKIQPLMGVRYVPLVPPTADDVAKSKLISGGSGNSDTSESGGKGVSTSKHSVSHVGESHSEGYHSPTHESHSKQQSTESPPSPSSSSEPMK